MNITSINLAGTIEEGRHMPRAFARLSRSITDEHIDVELLTPSGECTNHIVANDRDDQWSMAETLQHTLDGHQGTNGDIDGYFRIIQMLAD